MFIALRLTWMSLLIYFASKAMLVMLGLEATWLPAVTLATGVVAITYASLGGLRAVVITDLLQSVLLFGGAVLVVVTVTIRVGGFSWFPTSWNPTWDTQPLYSLDPEVRVTLLRTFMATTLWWICTAGGDQTAVQRFMATRDAAAARRSFLINSIAGAMVSLVLALVGFALLGYFETFPERLQAGLSVQQDADLLFPHFISHHLPVGLSGLVVCGMFAAAMSSLDSGVNSISAVVTTDLVDRFRAEPMGRTQHVRMAQILAFAIGLTVVFASTFMDAVPGNFLEVTLRTTGLFVVPIFLLFFMALYVPKATPLSANLSALASFIAAIAVAYWEPLRLRFWPQVGPETISFQLIFPASLLGGLLIGYSLSLFRKRTA
jgi:SSS family solute:Na+ symporter